MDCASYFFLPLACANALAAADFDVALVLPSVSTLEAAVAAAEDVCFLGELVWERALAAAVRDLAPVDGFCSVFDAAVAALEPVVRVLLIYISSNVKFAPSIVAA